MTVAEGSIVGVIGPSGAGKTTAIRIITGGIAPDDGTARVLGEDPRRYRRQTRESIGYMPQLFVLYPDLTVDENLDFIAALFGLLPWQRRKRIDAALELVQLSDVRDRRAADLSGGMQRRLELACALVHQPRLLILDEPTAGIDPLLRARIWAEIERLRQEGKTVLVTTQYVTEAEYCDQVALIAAGQLIACGSPQELRRMALGGEVIEIGTQAPFDAQALAAIPGVISVRQSGMRAILVVADDAGVAQPLVVAAVERAGGKVEFSREYRPTFDEVFTTLVSADAERREQPTAGSDSGDEAPQLAVV